MQNEAVVEGYRLSPQQMRIWLLQQTDGSRVYRTQSAVLIEGEIDMDSLKAAISDAVSRHEILRACFHLLPGMTVPLQAIDPDQSPALREVDLSDCDPDEKSASFDALFREERHYDLKSEPAARFCLIRMSVAERVLVASLPAICADSWSLKNLFRETARAYAASLRGARLADQPVQYVDFTEWQTEILERADDDEDERWDRQDWRSSSASPLRLGLERETDKSSRFEPDCLSLTLDAEITKKIDRISSAHNISPQVFLLACWQLLLWRLTSHKDIAVDHLCESLRIGALREAIGIFARFCPMSTHLEPDYQFTEMFEMVDQSIESANASLNHLLREDSKVMDSGGLAERTQAIGFEYEEWPRVERVGAVRFSYWKQYSSIDRFKLKLGGYRKADDLTIEIQFDATVFSRESVSLIQERYLTLIERAVQRDQALIGDLEIIGQRELEKLLIEWNATERKAPDRDCLHELIAKQAHSRPESIAVVYQNEQLSYGELESRANHVANYLKSLGVGPECVVGLYLERSTEMIVGLLGILKSGGAYLPLDIGQPVERLRIMLEDAGARVIVTEQYLAGRLPEGCRELVIIDEGWARVADCCREAPEVKVSPQNPAYVIYTSGSTGKPKGVMIRHDAVVNLLRGLQTAVYERAEGTLTVSLNASLGFDASVKQVIQLAHGHRLCIVPERERIDAESMVEYVRSKEIDVLDCTPSHLGILIEAGLKQGKKGPQIVLVGGEAISARNWREMSGNGEVAYYNVYGPTECTVDATVCRVGEENEPTVGRPINNTRIYILDEDGEVTPTGVVGEICIGGAGLARGYMGEAGMTAEKFVPDPYGGRSGERFYRSGDLGRYSEDGRIRIEGRRDEQVKVRGYRIELGEIEDVLKRHPGVRDAVAIVREDEPEQKQLVAYVAAPEPCEMGAREGRHHLNGGGTIGEARVAEREWPEESVDEPKWKITEERLRKYIRERVPDYMVPAAIIVMDKFPLTPNVKVDRRALPRPEEVKKDATAGGLERQNAYEEIIGGIWKDVLKVERVRPGESFFEIGGHSLLATQVVSRMRSAFGVEIGLLSIFEEPTVEGLACRVEDLIRTGEIEDAPPLVKVPRDGGLPLSFAQQRLWFLDQLAPNNPLYNCPRALRLEGPLDVEALESAINEIIRRHEVLRTRIEVDDGAPAQAIDEWAHRKLQIEDLASLTLEEREAAAARMAREEAATGFDLKRGPLLRVKVLRLGEGQHTVLFTMHHIVSDGWSMGILIREVGALYKSYSEGESSPLEELAIQYADYAVWQRQWLQGAVLEQGLDYWRKQLAGMDALDLPTDYPRPSARSYRGASRRFVVETEVAEKLRALGQREGATLFMTLLGGFDVLMSRYSGQNDVALGTDIANRNRAEIEGLIGFFVNQLALRVEVRVRESFGELLKRVREVCLGAYAHQDVPFEKLVEELQPERDMSRSPLFQAKFILQNAPREGLELDGIRLRSISSGEMQTTNTDLHVAITDAGRELVGEVSYSLDLFEKETIERLMRHYANVLREIAECERPICDLRLLSDEEREQIVVEWNRTERPFPQDRWTHELFREQVERTPERMAVMCGGQWVSYRELNRRANQLAHYLRGLGVGPEVVVALCLERSVELVVAWMGALKSGGAYLPLDPESPLERLEYILEDAGAVIVLTERRLEERLPSFWGQAVFIDEEWERIREESEDNPECEAMAENLAYVVYTSGSTGRPKGVMISHGGLAMSTLARLHYYRDPVSSFPLVSNVAFDTSVAITYWTLCQGGTLVLPYGGQERDAAQLVRLIIENNISHLLCFPTLYSLLLREIKSAQVCPLRDVMVVGETFPPDLVEEHVDTLADVNIFNEYGPTEGSVWCSVYDDCAKTLRSSVSIGKPIPNAQMFILDKQLEPAPIGARGEIYISGAGLARGYVQRTELTGEQFIPNPFSRIAGERMYRTGDMGRYLSDGNMEFIGRADDQVKIRGYRIELGEIETVLREHRSVSQSVVIAEESERGGKRLVAYVVGDEGATAAELKRHIREKLPEYMAPQAIVALDDIPLTANGKVDRKRLLTLSEIQQSRENLIAPRDILELQLLQMWESVLGVKQIGVRDNFFELGGHSLLAASLIARIRKVTGQELPLSALFEGGTIEYLASILRRENISTAWSCLVKLQTAGSQPPLVFVHPAGGDVLCYLDLARCLGSDRPFYGLQAVSLYEKRSLQRRVEEMAAHYIEELKAVQPEGPYFLGGWSLGGTIAYEMAQQLIASGQLVSQLLLLDSMSYRFQKEDVEEEGDDAALLLSLFSKAPAISPEELDKFQGDERIDYIIKKAISLNLLPPGIDVAQVRPFLETYKANVKAVYQYIPQVYPGTITLFKTTKQAVESQPDGSAAVEQTTKMTQDPTKGWGEVAAGGVRVIYIPGRHATMLNKPHVETLALQIKTCLSGSAADDDISQACAN